MNYSVTRTTIEIKWHEKSKIILEVVIQSFPNVYEVMVLF